jgi:hypothetical protein
MASTLGTGFFQPQARPGGVTITQQSLADEIAPFMKDYLERESALASLRSEGLRDEEGALVLDDAGQPIDPGGYKAYTGQTIAEFTPEQLAAQSGLTSLAGFETTIDPVTGERTIERTGPGLSGTRYQDAEALIRGHGEEFTGDVAERFMSPFQQAVIDIEKREAQQKFEQEVLPKLQAAQIGSGSFGGSRGAILEAEAMRGQQQLLGDIQAKGLQSAYNTGLKAFEQQKARERGEATALIGLSPSQLGQQARELQGLEKVGAVQQQQTQSALDELYKEFLEEQAFPEQVLDRMQGAAFGFPNLRQEVRQNPTTFGPSPFATLASGVGAIGTGVGNLFGQLGGKKASGSKHGGVVSRREGGLVPLIRRQNGGVPYEGQQNTPGNRFDRVLSGITVARAQQDLDREALRKRQAALVAARKGRLEDRNDPLMKFFAGLARTADMPASGDYRDLGMFGGLNLGAASKEIEGRTQALEKEYRTLEEREEDAKLAEMQADISRTGQRAEEDLTREMQRQQYTTTARKADLDEEKESNLQKYRAASLELEAAKNDNDLEIAKKKLVFRGNKLAQEQANKDRNYKVNVEKLNNAIRNTNIKQKEVVSDLLKDTKFEDSLATGYHAYALQQLEQAGVSAGDAAEILATAMIGKAISSVGGTPKAVHVAIEDGTIKEEDVINARQSAIQSVSRFYKPTRDEPY